MSHTKFDSKPLKYIPIFLAVLAVLSCGQGRKNHRSYKEAYSKTYAADVVLRIACGKWRELRLVYATNQLRTNAYQMGVEEKGKFFDKYEDRLVLRLPRELTKQETIGDTAREPVHITYPPGKLSLFIDNKFVADFSPDTITDTSLSFLIEHKCPP